MVDENIKKAYRSALIAKYIHQNEAYENMPMHYVRLRFKGVNKWRGETVVSQYSSSMLLMPEN